jgi:hypothetical protein
VVMFDGECPWCGAAWSLEAAVDCCPWCDQGPVQVWVSVETESVEGVKDAPEDGSEGPTTVCDETGG